MKRLDLIKMIEGLGCIMVRHGARHDWIEIRRRVFRSRCQGTARSKNR